MKWKEFHFGTDSFKPKPAYCWDNLTDAKCEALSTSSSSFWAWALEYWSGKSYRAFRILQGQTFCFCLRISVFHDLLSHQGMEPSHCDFLWAEFGELHHVWGSAASAPPPPSVCTQLEPDLTRGPGEISSFIFPAVLRGLYRKRCCVLKLETSVQHS